MKAPGFWGRWSHASRALLLASAATAALVWVGLAVPGGETVFGFVYILLAGTSLLALGCWFSSEFLYRRHPKNRDRVDPRRGTLADIRKYRGIKRGGGVAIVAAFALGLVAVRAIDRNREFSVLKGRLYPSAETLPMLPSCAEVPSERALFVYFSPDWVGGSDQFPHTLVRVKGRDLVVLDRKEDGALCLSFTVYDRDGRPVARMERGSLTLNPGNRLKVYREDRSHLGIRDKVGSQVIDVRFFNRRAIWVDAVLHDPEYPYPIVLRGSGLVANNCCYKARAAEVEIR